MQRVAKLTKGAPSVIAPGTCDDSHVRMLCVDASDLVEGLTMMWSTAPTDDVYVVNAWLLHPTSPASKFDASGVLRQQGARQSGRTIGSALPTRRAEHRTGYYRGAASRANASHSGAAGEPRAQLPGISRCGSSAVCAC